MIAIMALLKAMGLPSKSMLKTYGETGLSSPGKFVESEFCVRFCVGKCCSLQDLVVT